MKLHLDGDLIVYRCGFAVQKGDDVEPVGNALHLVNLTVNGVLDALDGTPDDLTVYLSGPTNFREGIAKTRVYKGNRDPLHKPVHGKAIKDYLAKKWDTKYSVDEEADDLVAYSHYAMFMEDHESSCIVSVDKDLNMIPGFHYNFVKQERCYIDRHSAMMFFYTQLLTGDATDNIPGLQGVGKRKAGAYLAPANGDESKIKQIVQDLYREYYGEHGDDVLLEQGRLIWMRRNPNEMWSLDYDVA